MTFGGRTRTKAEDARFDAIKELRECMACKVRGCTTLCGPIEVHHLTDCGFRRGHDATIGLGAYHHRRAPHFGHTVPLMRKAYGPSLMDGSKAFAEAYGEDDFLLRMQDAALGVAA